MADSSKITKLEAKIAEITGRPTYSSTPAWQQEVKGFRLEIETLRTGQQPERAAYERITITEPVAETLHVDDADADPGLIVGEGEVDHHDHGDPGYAKIWFILGLFTLLEWKCASWFGVHGVALWIVLSLMALVKAVLVALYFMHLKYERKFIYYFLAIPVFLVIVMVGLLRPDAGFWWNV